MSLMLPPHRHLASAVGPLVVERKFRVSLRCNHCLASRAQEIDMVDELDGRGTTSDFYRSGAIACIDPFCPKCGAEGATITDTAYVRGPNEREPAEADA